MNKSAFTLETLTATCETIYQRDGFVRWVDVANILNVSRQAVQLRLKYAVQAGKIEQSTYERWQSMSSRRTTIANNAKAREKRDSSLTMRCLLTEENHAWLHTECENLHVSRADIVNGLITKARLARVSSRTSSVQAV